MYYRWPILIRYGHFVFSGSILPVLELWCPCQDIILYFLKNSSIIFLMFVSIRILIVTLIHFLFLFLTNCATVLHDCTILSLLGIPMWLRFYFSSRMIFWWTLNICSIIYNCYCTFKINKYYNLQIKVFINIFWCTSFYHGKNNK